MVVGTVGTEESGRTVGLSCGRQSAREVGIHNWNLAEKTKLQSFNNSTDKHAVVYERHTLWPNGLTTMRGMSIQWPNELTTMNGKVDTAARPTGSQQ